MEGPSRPPPDFVAAAFHWLEYLGLLVAIGSLVVRRLAGLKPRIEWAEPPLAVTIAGALAGLIGLVATWPPRSILIGGVHVLSAGMWAGGILVMAFLRPPGGWNGTETRLLIERFARVALIAFVVTAFTGVIQATDRLHDVTDLWTTAYGLTLSVKVVWVAVMGALSLAWRRGLPVARLDAAAAIVVVTVTALLAAIPGRA
ncbi:MAG TPA: CopD family protein [Candidatus Dormibacteraeota bacterium]|nr:CopD family protein [Candidatus Dormibacteraeota bacterium]